MSVKLHVVYGGELVEPQSAEFRDWDNIDVIGVFRSYDDAHAAWKDAAQRTVDNAHMRYFIAHLHRLKNEDSEASAEPA